MGEDTRGGEESGDDISVLTLKIFYGTRMKQSVRTHLLHLIVDIGELKRELAETALVHRTSGIC